MIHKLGQVMLYVEDLDKAKTFWTEKLDFTVLNDKVEDQGLHRIEVVPKNAGTSLVLTDKTFVAEMEPEMNLSTPSLMFFTDDIEGLYSEMSEKNISLGDLVTLSSGEKVFNFSDDENNYFAVMEK